MLHKRAHQFAVHLLRERVIELVGQLGMRFRATPTALTWRGTPLVTGDAYDIAVEACRLGLKLAPRAAAGRRGRRSAPAR